jgi:DNA-directed RNA polymerase specialized sigma24 family protein
MTPDSELLRRSTDTQSEEAFAELVRRHLDLLYSAALRQVNGDAHLVQDVAQTVFTDLARKAASLGRRAVLTGWLYTSAHFAAATARKNLCANQSTNPRPKPTGKNFVPRSTRPCTNSRNSTGSDFAPLL